MQQRSPPAPARASRVGFWIRPAHARLAPRHRARRPTSAQPHSPPDRQLRSPTRRNPRPESCGRQSPPRRPNRMAPPRLHPLGAHNARPRATISISYSRQITSARITARRSSPKIRHTHHSPPKLPSFGIARSAECSGPETAAGGSLSLAARGILNGTSITTTPKNRHCLRLTRSRVGTGEAEQ